MKVSDAQLMAVAANLLAQTIHTPQDLRNISDEDIQAAFDLTQRIIDNGPMTDVSAIDAVQVKQYITEAFAFIDDETAQATLLKETIRQLHKIGQTTAMAIIQMAEKLGYIKSGSKGNTKTTIYTLAI